MDLLCCFFILSWSSPYCPLSWFWFFSCCLLGLFCLLLACSCLYAALFSMLVLLACFPFCLVLGLACCYVVGFAFCAGSLPVCSLVLLVCFPLDLVLGLAYCCVVGFAIYAGFLFVFSWLLKSRFDYCCWLCWCICLLIVGWLCWCIVICCSILLCSFLAFVVEVNLLLVYCLLPHQMLL